MITLTLQNPNVSDFFNGKTDDPPVGEFLYVHSRPIADNFVSGIEEMILHAGLVMVDNKTLSDRYGKVMLELAIELGEKMGSVDKESAPHILFTLRKIYQICAKVMATKK